MSGGKVTEGNRGTEDIVTRDLGEYLRFDKCGCSKDWVWMEYLLSLLKHKNRQQSRSLFAFHFMVFC